MSFRETSAWITLVTVLLCFGVYFGAIGFGIAPHGMMRVHLLLACLLALIILQIVLRVIAARLSPADARSPKDEREELIELRALRIGYYFLAISAFACGFLLHIGQTSAVELMNVVLLAIVTSVVVVSLAQIVQFRRGV
jgi:cytochrome b561